MLIGAAAIWLYSTFFGGPSDPAGKVFDGVEDRIGEHVKDKAKRKAAGTVLDGMRKTREGVFDKVEGLAERLAKAHSGHATPRAETEKLLEELDGIRKEAWSKQLDARFKLRETMSRDEWARVFPAPRR
jgi:hypothetical protein